MVDHGFTNWLLMKKRWWAIYSPLQMFSVIFTFNQIVTTGMLTFYVYWEKFVVNYFASVYVIKDSKNLRINIEEKSRIW